MKCGICEVGCDIAEGRYGRCRSYENRGGAVLERFPDSWMNLLPISIETMPILHWKPRSKALQVNTLGCNFSCPGCVSEILCAHVDAVSASLKRMPPEKVVEKALSERCKSLVFCLNDPVVSMPSFLRLASAAEEKGLSSGCSTNGYFTKGALKELIPRLDFVNIGLKGATDARYRECGAAKGSWPVFRNLSMLHEAGVHCEVSAMYMKGAEDEVRLAAEKVAGISEEIPFQVMRFVPFGEADIASEPSIRESEELCAELVSTHLRHVYLFNSPGTRWLDTRCPECNTPLLTREFYGPMGAKVTSWTNIAAGCISCGAPVPVKGEVTMEGYEEYGMLGGYRMTRGLEMVHAILVCLGASDEESLGQVWGGVVKEEFMRGLHDRIQRPESYIALVRDIAARAGRVAEGEKLACYMEEELRRVDGPAASSAGERPRVFYCMGYPLFALNADRFETNLVAAAGGECVNKRLLRKGKPGVNITKEELSSFDPEIILISGFLSSPPEDNIRFCEERGITPPAVREGRVYGLPPGWDFGSPRWVLGLFEIANRIRPDLFSFDIAAERERFYTTFYGISADDICPNRDFSRPSAS